MGLSLALHCVKFGALKLVQLRSNGLLSLQRNLNTSHWRIDFIKKQWAEIVSFDIYDMRLEYSNKLKQNCISLKFVYIAKYNIAGFWVFWGERADN